ncbi:MAG: NADP-dependent malic enzyme [Odoribacteraceae bacterium]|jgi:malate dehydrogenase (oxaloacetate-decarboxylating)(NADP+)|nr:NADP-dependent malic enzyme [Odoribacteraceae bacterium]
MAHFLKEEALKYHATGKPGKIEVIPTKPYSTQADLSLAYSPGVAEPCLAIAADEGDAYKYTAKGNLVAVISNGTAVLGLGNIGAMAGKPVMEGKGLLFKIFADIDVFDVEVDTEDVDKFVETVKLIAPTFGGINLEDIKAPECFEIEERLKRELRIPVMHDDQHGTAIISSAALLNALEIAGKRVEEVKVVVNGAGASAVACTKLYVQLGVRRENVTMCDSKGVIHATREDLNASKREFATTRDVHTLAEAIAGADVFLGLSKADVLTPEMIRSMAALPVVFALANPNPEIAYDLAIGARRDIIFATGRSDYPNQVNNVLGFPYIFRGALDVRATCINEAMKVAAVKALAALAKEPVPDTVVAAYNKEKIVFGTDYLIPKPMDPRLITAVAPAVAQAAIESGVARQQITDWDAYVYGLEARMGLNNSLVREVRDRARLAPGRIVFSGGDNVKVLQAARELVYLGIARPVLVGDAGNTARLARENNVDLQGITVIDPWSDGESLRRERYAHLFFEKMKRKGIALGDAYEKMKSREYFALMMVESGDADGCILHHANSYLEALRPTLQIIGTDNAEGHVAGMYILLNKKGPMFFSDVLVNASPTVETLVQTTVLTAAAVKRFNIEPRVALLSFSNFGMVPGGSPRKVARAVEILHEAYPALAVDGEMQANMALDGKERFSKFPFNKLKDERVNTFIFPCLSSGNIVGKFIRELGGTELVGPVLLGLARPVHVMSEDAPARDLVNIAAIAVVDARNNQDR